MSRLLCASLPHLGLLIGLYLAGDMPAWIYLLWGLSLLLLWIWASASIRAPLLGRCRNQLATSEPVFALTFDDGPGPHTGALLDLLDERRVQATFFLVGSKAAAAPELVQRMTAAGHQLGNHSMHHQVRAGFRAASLRGDIQSCQAALIAAGSEAPTIYRPPCGVRTHATHPVCAQLGLDVIGWSCGGHDGGKRAIPRILAGIDADLRPGSIVLLHDGGPDPERILELCRGVLDRAATKGLRPCRLDQRQTQLP